DYKGGQHQPPCIKLTWGTMDFKCKLKSMNINYTLFKPDGSPLRAKINLSFVGTMDKESEEKLKSTSSPDLSHIRTVYEGDTLPLMCQKIYGDSSMYLKVAQVNNLVNFRNLEPGTEILFPPIR
ncbi:MAG: LysM peptidoglycan-binding domain-containing protein, partial [Cytophagaceae bacterium]